MCSSLAKDRTKGVNHIKNEPPLEKFINEVGITKKVTEARESTLHYLPINNTMKWKQS